MLIDVEKFKENDIRVGLIQEVKNIIFKKNNYIKIVIDFGPEISLKTTILKASDNIFFDDLVNRQVVGLVNVVPKKITGIISNVLLLGVNAENGEFALLVPNRSAIVGGKVY